MRVRDLGYARRVVADPPNQEYLARFADTRVIMTDAPIAGATPFTTVGERWLYLMDGAPPAGASVVSDEPLLERRASTSAPPVRGIDGSVRSAAAPAASEAELETSSRGDVDTRSLDYTLTKVGIKRVHGLLASGLMTPLRRDDDPVRVVVVDAEVDEWERVTRDPPRHLPLALEPQADSSRRLRLFTPRRGAQHGTLVAAQVKYTLGSVPHRLNLLSIAPELGDELAPRWLGPIGLTWAISEAVNTLRADVIVIAMSYARWGMPKHLSSALREAARAGALIVCSTGDFSNADFTPSPDEADADAAALGADELASQPWVLAVGATDEDGHWYRRYVEDAVASQSPIGRFGPALALAAPGFYTRLDEFDGQLIDDTSLACALVGGVAAMLCSLGPWRAADVRRFLTASAELPSVIDPAFGLGSGAYDNVDRTGHNFKLGYGEVNATAAALLAFDPVTLGFVLASPRSFPGPSWRGFQRSPHLLLAQSFLGWCKRARLPERFDSLRLGYIQLRPALLRVLLSDASALEALLWLARHLGAVLSSRTRARAWKRESDHGELVARLEHLCDALKDGATRLLQAEAEAGAVQRWCDALSASLPKTSPGSVALAVAIAEDVLDFTRPDFREEAR
ncbi:MAG TPA: S8/S53 family peptidase [Polyangiaceae bacterium]|nr:S8/S53 family peptidase [Polyangiaceae bacterium]